MHLPIGLVLLAGGEYELGGGAGELVPGLAHIVVALEQSVAERVPVEGKPSIEVRHPDGHIIHGVERRGAH
jgi:hypothetical protein